MVDAVFAACLAMLVTVAVGHPIVAELRRRKLGKAHTGDEPEAYASKAGTPVMGGVMFLIGLTVAAFPFTLVEDEDMLIPLGAMLVAATLGIYDDAQNLVGAGRVSGHEPWFWAVKWGVHLAIAVVVAVLLYDRLELDAVLLPHFGAYSLGAAYIPVLVAIFLAATSGAVITDGMDGLMAGVSAFAFGCYAVIALAQGQDELGAFALSAAAAAAAFLYFNANPAQVFMGEVGSQSLAVGVVVVAFMTGWWLLLPVICVVFFIEGLSAAIQIAYFKATHGKRVFRMAPIHYHFQLGGWTETQVVVRFWLLAMLGALAGIGLALVE
jgi:phospho-N-acetylmuramoyl-pentapeptide-transferase